jgi:hypothetical protein
MADSLRLLFEIDTDPSRAVANFKRLRTEFAREIASLRKLVAQPFTLPSIKPSAQGSASSVRGAQADDHVKEFRRIEAEAAKSAKAQERIAQDAAKTIASIDRQRSREFLAQRKAEERAAAASAKAQERAIAASFKAQERLPARRLRPNSKPPGKQQHE